MFTACSCLHFTVQSHFTVIVVFANPCVLFFLYSVRCIVTEHTCCLLHKCLMFVPAVLSIIYVHYPTLFLEERPRVKCAPSLRTRSAFYPPRVGLRPKLFWLGCRWTAGASVIIITVKSACQCQYTGRLSISDVVLFPCKLTCPHRPVYIISIIKSFPCRAART